MTLPLSSQTKLSISSQFSAPHTHELKPTTSTDKTPLISFCPLMETEVSKLLLSSHPTTCSLDPIPSHLLQAISPKLLPALTHLSLQAPSPMHSNRLELPHFSKETTFNISFTDSYRSVSRLLFIAKTLEQVVFNQLSSFVSKNHLLDANQSGFRRGHSTETMLLCHCSLADCKSWFQIIDSHPVGSICCF